MWDGCPYATALAQAHPPSSALGATVVVGVLGATVVVGVLGATVVVES